MELRVDGKVALVTGGGSGIGAAAAEALAAAGAAVAVVDYRQEAAAAVAERLTGAGGRALALAADVRDEAAVAAAVEQTASELGGLHIVFANAGINGMQCPIEEMTLEEWRETLDTNLTGTFLTVKHSIPRLREAGGGSIIVTASVNGNTIFSLPGYSCYSTSKGGQVIFTKMAALELARWNIRVNAIMPGGVATNIGERTYRRNLEQVRYEVKMPEPFPPLLGRRADAEEMANVVLFLASDASRYMTGAELLVDAAASLLRA